MGADIALAAVTGAASFAVFAVALAAADSAVVAVLLACVGLAAVFAITHKWGAAYAIPVVFLGLVAYDWFQFPPTHPEEFPDRQNFLSLLAYLLVAALAAELARYASRRAIVSEAARTELAGEQSALRRVATLVAKEATPEDIFAKVAEEAATVLGTAGCSLVRDEGDGSATVVGVYGPHASTQFPLQARIPLEGNGVVESVLRDGRPHRIDDYSAVSDPVSTGARERGIASAVGGPIVVGGRTWGAMVVTTYGTDPAAPADTETRIAQFAELVATAIANAEARAQVEQLADEQAALRRIATLVAQRVPPAEIFAAVSNEVAGLFESALAAVGRFESDGSAFVALAPATDAIPVGSRWALDDSMAIAGVFRTGRSARVEGVDWSSVGASIAEPAGRLGVASSVASPIVVGGSVWGAISISGREPLPPDTEVHLEQFTDLVATAISDADSRQAVSQLADEQAALRRVATLVAEGVAPAELFAAVTREFAGLFATPEPAFIPSIVRFDPGPEFVLVGSSEPEIEPPIGSRWEPTDLYASTRVFRTGSSAQVDAREVAEGTGPEAEYLRRERFLYQAGAPIVVEGRLWGAMTVNSSAPLPTDTGKRLDSFTELVATAIANTESRAAVEELAGEQAALRRVATVVAEGSGPELVFAAIADEVEALLGADICAVVRFEVDGTVTVKGAHGGPHDPGARVELEPGYVVALVRETGEPARFDTDDPAAPGMPGLVRKAGIRSATASPILVDRELWGAITIASTEGRLPLGTQQRLAEFTELLATAIANADSRDQLAASRVRLLTAGDEARRQVVRDLHDGAQQRLVHSIITLRLAQRALEDSDGEGASLVSEALEQAEQGNLELRELAHGILPSALTRGGLRAGVDTVVARLDLPVDVDIADDRFPEEIEASAYFIVAESLTNVVKHAGAGRAAVRASLDDGFLHLEVRDDGAGGADPDGHGLVGLRDRATALGGRLEVESPVGRGTAVTATLPLSAGQT